jgi:hypothetical protein
MLYNKTKYKKGQLLVWPGNSYYKTSWVFLVVDDSIEEYLYCIAAPPNSFDRYVSFDRSEKFNWKLLC